MDRKKILAACTVLLLVVCAAPALRAQTGNISGNPPVCEIFLIQNTCTVTITWSSQGASLVEVWVQTANGEALFARTGTGGPYSQDAPWIQEPTYQFKLYALVNGVRGALLDSVSVHGERSLRCEPQ